MLMGSVYFFVSFTWFLAASNGLISYNILAEGIHPGNENNERISLNSSSHATEGCPTLPTAPGSSMRKNSDGRPYFHLESRNPPLASAPSSGAGPPSF